MAAELFHARCGVKQPKWSYVGLGAAFLGMILPIVSLAVARHVPALFISAAVCLLFGWMGLRYGLSATRGVTFSSAILKVGHDRALRAEGRLLARRSDLRQGFVFPTEDGVLVRLERSGTLPPIVLRVADEAEGERLIRALGFGADRVAAFMRIASSLSAMSGGKQATYLLLPLVPLMLGLFGLSSALPGHGDLVGFASTFGVLAYMAYALALAFLPTDVRIGTDGVLTRWAGKERFIPFAEVRSATVYQEYVAGKYRNGVALNLPNGAEVKLPTGQTDIGEAEARRLAHRIQEAHAARARGLSAPAGATLARGERSVVEWVSALRRLGAGAVDHRTAFVPVEKLLQIVEDTAAPAADRVAAAVAASAGADAATAKRRVHIAAETTVSPQLRVALVRIAESPPDAPDEELAPYLAEIDATRTASPANPDRRR